MNIIPSSSIPSTYGSTQLNSDKVDNPIKTK